MNKIGKRTVALVEVKGEEGVSRCLSCGLRRLMDLLLI